MTAPDGIPVITADRIEAAMTPAGAVESIARAVADGIDVENDHERIFAPLMAGEFLLMPSQSAASAGIKVATIAPGNSDLGLPKISAWYLLFDGRTLQPVAIVDGTRLTTLRTPAVTAVAVRGLLAADPDGAKGAVDHLAVLGSGPQAIEHVRTLGAILAVGRVTIIGRSTERVRAAVSLLRAEGFDAAAGAHSSVATADVVVTATSSATPVLALADIRPGAVVAAIGAHGLDHRELADDLVRAADLVVEARASATRENGNLVGVDGAVAGAANLVELVRGEVRRRPSAPAVYTGVGMAWEDLAVVEGIMEITRRAPAQEEST